MGQLFFKKHFQDAIRAGTKLTTIRRWHKPMLKVDAIAFSPGLGWLSIHAVESVELENLNDADARADGFETAEGLREVLVKFYPDHARDGKKWFRVFFTLSREVRHPHSKTTKRHEPDLFSNIEKVKSLFDSE